MEDPYGLHEIEAVGKNGFIELKSNEVSQIKRFNGKGEPVIKILTYNIWFNFVTIGRINRVLRAIDESLADFICLQEVTEESM